MVSSVVTTDRLKAAGAHGGSQLLAGLNRSAQSCRAHRTELLFLAATLAFAIVAAVIGIAVLPSF